MSDSAVIINDIKDSLNYEMLITFHKIHTFIVEKYIPDYTNYCFSNDDLIILLQEELENILDYHFVDNLCDIYTSYKCAGYLQIDINKYMHFLKIKKLYQEKNGSLQLNNPVLCEEIEKLLYSLQNKILDCYYQCNHLETETDLSKQFDKCNIINSDTNHYQDDMVDDMIDYMNKYYNLEVENNTEIYLQSNLSNLIAKFIKKLSKQIVYQ